MGLLAFVSLIDLLRVWQTLFIDFGQVLY